MEFLCEVAASVVLLAFSEGFIWSIKTISYTIALRWRWDAVGGNTIYICLQTDKVIRCWAGNRHIHMRNHDLWMKDGSKWPMAFIDTVTNQICSSMAVEWLAQIMTKIFMILMWNLSQMSRIKLSHNQNFSNLFTRANINEGEHLQVTN